MPVIISVPPSDQRKHVLSHNLDGSVVMSSVGYRQSAGSDCHSLKRDMFEIIDKMTGELDKRFSNNEPFHESLLHD